MTGLAHIVRAWRERRHEKRNMRRLVRWLEARQ